MEVCSSLILVLVVRVNLIAGSLKMPDSLLFSFRDLLDEPQWQSTAAKAKWRRPGVGTSVSTVGVELWELTTPGR
jgi:hypothetical protein